MGSDGPGAVALDAIRTNIPPHPGSRSKYAWRKLSLFPGLQVIFYLECISCFLHSSMFHPAPLAFPVVDSSTSPHRRIPTRTTRLDKP
jgi:hypothetical protein